MKKSTWYQAKGRTPDQIRADVGAMRDAGIATLLCNADDEQTLDAVNSLLAGDIDIHAEISIHRLHWMAMNCRIPAAVFADPDAYDRDFPQYSRHRVGCCSPLTDPAPFVSALMALLDRHPFVKGLSLDGVRYPNTVLQERHPCSCPACCARRLPWLGHGPLTPDDLTDPSLVFKEVQSKGQVIANLISAISAAVRSRGLRLSIAARAVYAGRDTQFNIAPMWGYGPAVFEGQDWAAWCRDGWLDDIHFMNYSTDFARFERLARSHLALAGQGRAALYEGIGVSSSAGKLPIDTFRRQLDLTCELGMTGVTIFSWTAATDEHRAVLKQA